MKRYVISLLAPDRVGIVKNITTAISDLGGNIDGMSQTVVNGYFTIILTATFSKELSVETIRERIADHFAENDISVIVRPFDESVLRPQETKSDRYILTITGKDRPGILKTLTTYLFENNINIEDYYFTIRDGHVTHIGEITIPKELDIKQLQGELQTLLSSIDLVATLQHENIFRAANEIFSIQQLLKGTS